MKNYTLACCVLLYLTCSSCDILEQKPEGTLTKGTFYNNEKDAVAASNAMYSSMRTYQVALWRTANLLPSDNIIIPFYNPFERNREMDQYRFDASNRQVEFIWQLWYGTINKANAVLNQVPNIEMDENLKNRILGEGYFTRAYSYFNLVKKWGEVPLILEDNIQVEVESSSTDKIFEQIISELNKAEDMLPSNYDNPNVGRPTNTSATALLARVYQWRKNWDMAAQKAKQVIDSGKYALFDDYADNFSLDHENGKEQIFSYQFSEQFSHGWARDFEVPRGSNLIPGGGDAEFIPEIEAYNSYQENDYRRKVNFLTEYVNEEGDTVRFQEFDGGVPLAGKFYDRTRSETENGGLNRIIIRYADVLLIYAEAMIELNNENEAYQYLNMVRERARNGDPNAPPQDIPQGSLTKSEFRDTLFLERRHEFMFEGLRRDDLVIAGKLIEAMRKPGINGGENIQEHQVLFPKPGSQLELNPLLGQNPGYQ